MLANKLLGAALATQPVFIEDTFSTYLYTGTGASQTITNGIDLAGKGGMTWFKVRSDAGYDNAVVDSARGISKILETNLTNAEATQAAAVTAYNSNGFTLGTDGGGYGSSGYNINPSGVTLVSWTFREQAKFFDVVTYTGTGPGTGANEQQVSHNLGSKPGAIIIKRTDSTGDWWFFTDVIDGTNDFGYLNKTDAFGNSGNNVPTSTVFNVGGVLNTSGATYVAYLFANNAGGFGLSGTDNVITCGSYTTDGSGNINSGSGVNLGYEPQFIIAKRTDSSTAGSWNMIDSMRGWVATPATTSKYLFSNTSGAEGDFGSVFQPTATGFSGVMGGTSATYIYIAIRRPMKTPTSGTSVFSPSTRTGTGATATTTGVGFPPDLLISAERTNVSGLLDKGFHDRLRGNVILRSNTTAAEATDTPGVTAYGQDGFTFGADGSYATVNYSGASYVYYPFRRAPGFFDIVCDTGTASGHTINHGLTVVPELMIRKKRNSATNSDWVVWHTAFTGTNKYLYLNSTAAEDTNSAFWTTTAPTSTVFSVGTGSRVNNLNDTYVTYLFATVAGVSKVGSYTGTGTTLTIDCGFTAGARFVMIKRTSSTGDWYVWDTARGIISGNDPYLLMNSSAAEVTNTDYIDPVNSGFQISSTAPVQINGSGGTFIYLAIA